MRAIGVPTGSGILDPDLLLQQENERHFRQDEEASDSGVVEAPELAARRMVNVPPPRTCSCRQPGCMSCIFVESAVTA